MNAKGDHMQRQFLKIAAVLMALVAARSETQAWAQGCGGGGGFGRQQAVGGVMIDTNGVLLQPTVEESGELARTFNAALDVQSTDIQAATPLRKVSLRKLQSAIDEKLQAGQPLTQEMRFLAGLQEIRYVLVYPEQQDIVVAGFGEGWVGGKHAIAVGRTTGRPALMLEDLLAALRGARRAAEGGISCSIDPTSDGLQKVHQYAATLTNADQLSVERLEELMGPQRISITGVLPSSHFARVLVAADYRMKRIGMKLDASPVAGLPSYLDMLPASGRGMQNLTPRWWLSPNYEALKTDTNGLAWELPASKVVAQTEDSFLAADGSKAQSGKSSPAAQQWATLMTKKYADLAAKDPIFAELKNCMDLAVVGALIVKENLASKANVRLTTLLDPTALPLTEYDIPKTTPAKASRIAKGSHVLVGASGGVLIQPAQGLERTERTATINPLHEKSTPNAEARWWWN